MAEIVWSERAIKDLENIGEYIAKDSIRYAELVVQKLFNRPQHLVNAPYLGRIVPEFESENIRELIEGSYRIVYLVSPDANQPIEIITVHHNKKEFLRLT